MNIIGPQIRKLREDKQLTQEEFTARCNASGWDISRGTLAKIESKVRRVTDEEALLLANVLGVNVSRLFEN